MNGTLSDMLKVISDSVGESCYSIIDSYHKILGYSIGTWYNWCAAFVTVCANRAGLTTKQFKQDRESASCTNLRNWAKSQGIWVDARNGNNPMPKIGYPVLFDWDLSGDCDHIEIVERVYSDNDGTWFTTVAGNNNPDKVIRPKRYNINQSTIAGYIAIEYTVEEEEDEMTREQFDKWFNENIDKYNEDVASREESKWAKEQHIIETAIDMGISDNGERPQSFAKREEVMAMIERAVDNADNSK